MPERVHIGVSVSTGSRTMDTWRTTAEGLLPAGTRVESYPDGRLKITHPSGTFATVFVASVKGRGWSIGDTVDPMNRDKWKYGGRNWHKKLIADAWQKLVEIHGGTLGTDTHRAVSAGPPSI